jgi:hypothetical protein
MKGLIETLHKMKYLNVLKIKKITRPVVTIVL